MKGTNFIMEKLDFFIRSANRDDVARILEIFETAVNSETDVIPLDANRPKLTPNGEGQKFGGTRLIIFYLNGPLGLDRDGFDTRDRAAYFHAVVAETKDVQSNGRKVIVGVVIYHFKYSTWVGQVVHLGSLAVDAPYRRKGVATKLMQYLGKMAVKNRFSRISFEVTSERSEAGAKLFDKLGAINLTKEEGWYNYSFSPEAVSKILQSVPEPVPSEVVVRRSEPKDCPSILAFIKDLATFEKMPNGPKLSVSDLQRDGFYKLFPLYLSIVAERTDPDTGDKEIVGYAMYFPTYSPYYGKRIHLEDIYVAPEHRSKGIATALFNDVAKYCHENGCWGFTLECLNWNAAAMKFYEKRFGVNVTKTQGQQSYRFFDDKLLLLGSH